MRRVPYTPSRKADEVRNVALYWWAEELTAEDRADFLATGLHLFDSTRGLGEAGYAELIFKLALLVGPELDGKENEVKS